MLPRGAAPRQGPSTWTRPWWLADCCLPTAPALQLCYPDAGYRQDAGLRAAVKAAPTWQELRSLMKATFPPPARIPGARQRSRSPPPRAARRAGQASALGVTKRISASILRFWRLCFTGGQGAGRPQLRGRRPLLFAP